MVGLDTQQQTPNQEKRVLINQSVSSEESKTEKAENIISLREKRMQNLQKNEENKTKLSNDITKSDIDGNNSKVNDNIPASPLQTKKQMNDTPFLTHYKGSDSKRQTLEEKIEENRNEKLKQDRDSLLKF
mmetsp:Transcript_6781/g.5930  ORF Transcript_6781/g.5930 Transcript_6781/m.5930 type:complete len:130 (+) Transcript_6781:311-700(+)